MKKNKIKIVLFFLLFLFLSSAKASLLWDYNTALDAYKKNNYSFCIRYLPLYIQNNPNDENGYYLLGQVYLKLKNTEKAKENFKKAYNLISAEKNIEKIDFSEKKGNIEDYFDMATMFFENGNIHESDFYADMMLEINPKSSSAYFIKAKIAKIKGDEKTATDYMNKAIMYNNKLLNTNLAKSLNIFKEPDKTKEIYSVFAFESYFSGDILSAIENAKKYLELDKTNEDMMNFLAELYIKIADIESAEKIVGEIFLINESNIQALLNKATIFRIKDDDKNELLTLKKIEKINPNNQNVLLRLGNYYLKKEDYKNSKKYFEILTNVNDKSYEAYFGLAYSLIELNKTTEAMPVLRKAALINPKTSEVPFLLSKICEKNARYSEASDYITQALKINKNPAYYFLKVEIEYMLGKYKDSNLTLDELGKMQNFPYDMQLLYNYRIKNYIGLKDDINAQKYLDKVLDKNSIIYKYNLYIIYKLKGNEKEASSLYSQLKKTKPKTILEYADLARVFYKQGEFKEAEKILNSGIKKFPKEPKLYYQMVKLYFLSGEDEKLKKTIEFMQKD